MRKYAARLAIGSIVISVFLGLSGSVNADSTIGTNISTTGTLTVKSNSTSAVSFQNAAGSSTLVLFNSAALRLGINYGSSLDASFEVGGTASANYLVTRNAAQIGNSGATVAYSRFGANATGHANYVTAAGDILVSGDLEVDGSVSFAGPASVSGILFLADGQVRPRTDATTAFRFQNAAGGTNVLTIDSTNSRIGIAAGTIDVFFEVGGTASANYLVTENSIQIGNSGATVAYSRFGTNATGHANYVTAAGDILVSGDLEVDGSVSFAGPASVSGILFLADGQVRPRTDATTAFRFQNAAGGTTILTVDSTNTRLGVGAVNTLDTALEVAGVASASGGLFVGAANNATTSITFDSIHATRGACLEIKDRDGSGFTYLRVNDGTGTFSTISCK